MPKLSILVFYTMNDIIRLQKDLPVLLRYECNGLLTWQCCRAS